MLLDDSGRIVTEFLGVDRSEPLTEAETSEKQPELKEKPAEETTPPPLLNNSIRHFTGLIL